MKMKWIILGTFLLNMIAVGLGDNLQNAYEEGKGMANGLSPKTISPSIVPGFKTDNPKEVQYQNGDLSDHSLPGASQDIVSFVNNSINKRPRLIIDKNNDPSIKRSIDASVTNAFCINGDCVKGDYLPSPDFRQAISALSGVTTASKDFNNQNQIIFTGYQKECRKDFVGYSNCCSDSGWGIDLNLTKCSGEETELGSAKEVGHCVEVGDYCSHKVLGFCTAHKRSYCCFNSKLAKIIQVQGRAQLGIGWGSGRSPDCRGLTVPELQRVNFSQIDFSEFYKDIQDKMSLPDVSQLQKTTKEKIQTSYNNSQ